MVFDYSVAPVFLQGAEVNVDLEDFVSQLRRAGIRYNQAVHDFRKQFILTLLLRHRGNQCAVAKQLGVHRNTMRRIVDELGIDPFQTRPQYNRTKEFGEQ